MNTETLIIRKKNSDLTCSFLLKSRAGASRISSLKEVIKITEWMEIISYLILKAQEPYREAIFSSWT